ncbi:hypothetical protein A3A71_02530 [Candidatus Berkelbacteria bacterium RIFCSPLOWO2_01_FULL_50_28]|uniref:LysM domain-containing protein n=1 Tax=Candidatus Berkelbacteria bacterium RIFCSPLOWO2_01_FULL_50_28 TaxID=1797471 RepID=A0A1F5EBW1_9BACT|nr:MAG: hypothetical protein A2807_00925 [Candidatus Berkelbacteria bacterium RIFCSPHIGHO2_01_FULL_50_36]OGD62254.1 MAG: hypothetical protein A3F39_00945 [Candidatus Berkelbacteria bacterium RIFCSPHIGHO2_12_FULL_50_11]OGD64897.1 MAG: hypothetical protein A3A71_02530 [Candidatus Berkelbacteria bacterium RIFCSPLOWO2_01_FULL_50_28]
MKIPPAFLATLVVLIGFLAAATYYYRSQTSTETKRSTADSTFLADVPAVTSSDQGKIVDKLTRPATPRGRLSYPANVYVVKPLEGLFTIGNKMKMDWRLIKRANNISNENSIQQGTSLAIPKLSNETDYFRLEFRVDGSKASELNRAVQSGDESVYLDPVKVVKKEALTYFGVTESDDFSVLEQDQSRGTALIQVKSDLHKTNIGLIQPKEKGARGIWAILYIESRDNE